MPNGHGGIPFLGAPVLFAVLFVAAAFWPLDVPSTANTVRVVACLVLALLAGQRLAYHLHMRHADEYGGAHVSEAERSAMSSVYASRSVIYGLGAASIGFGVLLMRGLV